MITDKDDPVTTPIERFRRIIPNALTDYGLSALNTADPTPRLVLNTSFLPKITEKGSGARTFVVRTVPRETVRTAMYLIDAVNPSAPDALSILRIFEEFKRWNSTVAGEDELLLLFAVDLMIQKIKASSVGTYVASIQRMRKRQNCAIHGPLVKDLKKIVAMLQCDDEIDHAVDITEEEAHAFLYTLSGQAQLAAFFLLVAGLRLADGARLTRAQLLWEADPPRLSIHYKYTKNRRTVSKQYTATFPLPMRLQDIPALTILNSLPTDRPFLTIGTDGFNTACRGLGIKDGVTSYSFRRLAIQRFIAQCTEGSGAKKVTNWTRAMALSGHVKLETLRTRYAQVWDQTL